MGSLSLRILSEMFLVEEIFQKKQKSGNNIKSYYSYNTMNQFFYQNTLSIPSSALYHYVRPSELVENNLPPSNFKHHLT